MDKYTKSYYKSLAEIRNEKLVKASDFIHSQAITIREYRSRIKRLTDMNIKLKEELEEAKRQLLGTQVDLFNLSWDLKAERSLRSDLEKNCWAG